MSFSDLMLFALSSNQDLAQRVSKEMGLPLGKSTVRQFSDGEIQVNIEESIRGKEVYILQSTSSPVNDNLMEILIMVDALKRASAQTINVVMPYYGYARQDRKARAREPITSKLVANMLEIAGVKVAMGNAMNSLKEIATDHADHYLQEGCANWIRKNLL